MATSKPFWADLSKRTGTWSAVAALALGIAEHVDDQPWNGPEWEHWAAVIGTAVLRAIVGLVQGNVGDRDKATFAPATGPTIDVPASDLRNGDDPDDG